MRPLRIALVQAPLGRREPLIYPLGIVTLASQISTNDEYILLDPNMTGLDVCYRNLKEFQPDIIGISLRNIDSQMKRDLFYYYLHFKEFGRNLRDLFPHACLIVGGSGYSLFPEQILKDNPWLDLGVYLEGESSFNSLLDHLNTPADGAGIFYRSEGIVKSSGQPELPSIEDMKPLPYDRLDPRPYMQNGGIGIQTKRGCPLHCIYCTYPHLNGPAYRFRSEDSIIQELSVLFHEYGVREFTFVDGVFNLPKSWAAALIDRMKLENLKFKWHAWFTELEFDRDFAGLCRDSGCSEFSFSPDGFSKETLQALGKSIHPEDIYRVVDVVKNTAGTRIALNFFWNPPGQTYRDFVKTILFCIKCKMQLKQQAGGIIFGNPRIEPHTPLWLRGVSEEIITEQQNLLPGTVKELEKMFYTNPGTPYLDWLFGIYTMVWRLKRHLRLLRS